MKHLPQLIRHAKECGFEEVSLVTNGSLIDEHWLRDLAGWLDILALSIDSLDPEINLKIGRHDDKKVLLSIESVRQMAKTCHEFGISLKINTFVLAYNKHEIMAPFIVETGVRRWKVLQVMRVEGQNDEVYEKVRITKEEFWGYVERNQTYLQGHSVELVPEPVELIEGSYVMLNPHGRFFTKVGGQYRYSSSILDGGVEAALRELVYHPEKFLERGGQYRVRDNYRAYKAPSLQGEHEIFPCKDDRDKIDPSFSKPVLLCLEETEVPVSKWRDVAREFYSYVIEKWGKGVSTFVEKLREPSGGYIIPYTPAVEEWRRQGRSMILQYSPLFARSFEQVAYGEPLIFLGGASAKRILSFMSRVMRYLKISPDAVWLRIRFNES